MTNQTIAAAILAQLGGNRLVAMVGANGFLNLEDGLQFKFKGSKRANCVRVILEPNDTYTVEFLKIKGFDVASIEKVPLVHAESLQVVFTRVTGLSLSL